MPTDNILFPLNNWNVDTLNVTSTTPSTSSGTGAIVTNGGIASSCLSDSINLTNGGSMTLAGGASIAKTLRTNNLVLYGTSTSTSGTAGSIITPGGIASSCVADSVDPTNGGALTIAGGAAIGKALRANNLVIYDGSASTNSSTGSLITSGGIYVGNDSVYLGKHSFTTNQPSTSSTTGTVVCSGGIYVGNNSLMDGRLTCQSIPSAGNAGASVVVAPSSVVASGSNNYYGTVLQPFGGSGTTTGTCSTVYITGNPTLSNSNNNYSLLIDGAGGNGVRINGTFLRNTFTGSSVAPNSGANQFSGGIGISLTQDAVSASNGGCLTIGGGAAIGKKLYVGDALYIPTTGGTASPLNHYEEYSSSFTFVSGASSFSSTVTIFLTRIGNIASLYIPSVGDGVNATAGNVISSTTTLPSRFAPKASMFWHVRLAVGGVSGTYCLFISTSGTMTFCNVNNSGTLPAGIIFTNAFGCSWVV